MDKQITLFDNSDHFKISFQKKQPQTKAQRKAGKTTFTPIAQCRLESMEQPNFRTLIKQQLISLGMDKTKAHTRAKVSSDVLPDFKKTLVAFENNYLIVFDTTTCVIVCHDIHNTKNSYITKLSGEYSKVETSMRYQCKTPQKLYRNRNMKTLLVELDFESIQHKLDDALVKKVRYLENELLDKDIKIKQLEDRIKQLESQAVEQTPLDEPVIETPEETHYVDSSDDLEMNDTSVDLNDDEAFEALMKRIDLDFEE